MHVVRVISSRFLLSDESIDGSDSSSVILSLMPISMTIDATVDRLTWTDMNYSTCWIVHEATALMRTLNRCLRHSSNIQAPTFDSLVVCLHLRSSHGRLRCSSTIGSRQSHRQLVSSSITCRPDPREETCAFGRLILMVIMAKPSRCCRAFNCFVCLVL